MCAFQTTRPRPCVLFRVHDPMPTIPQTPVSEKPSTLTYRVVSPSQQYKNTTSTPISSPRPLSVRFSAIPSEPCTPHPALPPLFFATPPYRPPSGTWRLPLFSPLKGREEGGGKDYKVGAREGCRRDGGSKSNSRVTTPPGPKTFEEYTSTLPLSTHQYTSPSSKSTHHRHLKSTQPCDQGSTSFQHGTRTGTLAGLPKSTLPCDQDDDQGVNSFHCGTPMPRQPKHTLPGHLPHCSNPRCIIRSQGHATPSTRRRTHHDPA